MTDSGSPHEPATSGAQLDSVVDRLCEEFDGVFSPETVAAVVRESHESLGHYTMDTYVGLLVHRFSREQLRSTAIVQGSIRKTVPEVLFVCVHNAGRSQMAAALMDHHAQGRVVVRSAGSAPADSINPAVVQAMAEVGLDLAQAFPKPLTSQSVQAADVVITMGCGDACPIFPGKRYLDWTLNDPAGQDLGTVRGIRDNIDARVQNLLAELLQATTSEALPG